MVYEEKIVSALKLDQSTAPKPMEPMSQTPEPKATVEPEPPKVAESKTPRIHLLAPSAKAEKTLVFANGDRITVPGKQSDIAHDSDLLETV